MEKMNSFCECNDLPVVSNHVHEGNDARTPIDKKNKETILSSAQGNNIEVWSTEIKQIIWRFILFMPVLLPLWNLSI